MHETNVLLLSNQEQLTYTLLTQKQLLIYRHFLTEAAIKVKLCFL